MSARICAASSEGESATLSFWQTGQRRREAMARTRSSSPEDRASAGAGGGAGTPPPPHQHDARKDPRYPRRPGHMLISPASAISSPPVQIQDTRGLVIALSTTDPSGPTASSTRYRSPRQVERTAGVGIGVGWRGERGSGGYEGGR